jgi:hypothetical protein
VNNAVSELQQAFPSYQADEIQAAVSGTSTKFLKSLDPASQVKAIGILASVVEKV